MCGTEGLASAQRLRSHGMPMLYFGWTRAKAQPGHARTGTKRKTRTGGLLGLLDIMARDPIHYRGLYIVIDKQ